MKTSIDIMMQERISKVIEHEGLTPSRFAEMIGIQRSGMSHILGGRNNPSLDVLKKILERFTYINSDWLLFGKGEMMRGQASDTPDLFTNAPVIQPEIPSQSENRPETKVETPVNTVEQPILQKFTWESKPAKKVSKIMIFYSDNTFDTFIPEQD